MSHITVKPWRLNVRFFFRFSSLQLPITPKRVTSFQPKCQPKPKRKIEKKVSKKENGCKLIS